tara:strand:- start:1049 stop:1360 length:312 start_codon:yes stop_codon:yes gene_type:complete
MIGMQNALGFIISLQGIDVVIKAQSDLTEYPIKAAQSNYFRKPTIDEQITGNGRSYVIASKGLTFVPTRGDTFTISEYEYYGIADAQEMRALGTIIGYRLLLE